MVLNRLLRAGEARTVKRLGAIADYVDTFADEIERLSDAELQAKTVEFRERYADGELTVRTDSTAWATQLRHMAPQLLALLNDQLGADTVSFVRVLGPDAPSWKHGGRSVRDGRGPRDTYG